MAPFALDSLPFWRQQRSPERVIPRLPARPPNPGLQRTSPKDTLGKFTHSSHARGTGPWRPLPNLLA